MVEPMPDVVLPVGQATHDVPFTLYVPDAHASHPQNIQTTLCPARSAPKPLQSASLHATDGRTVARQGGAEARRREARVASAGRGAAGAAAVEGASRTETGQRAAERARRARCERTVKIAGRRRGVGASAKECYTLEKGAPPWPGAPHRCRTIPRGCNNPRCRLPSRGMGHANRRRKHELSPLW